VPVASFRPIVAIAGNRLAQSSRHGQDTISPGLAAPQIQDTGRLVQIIESKSGNFPYPQAEVGHTQSHRIITPARGRGLIEALQKCLQLRIGHYGGQARPSPAWKPRGRCDKLHPYAALHSQPPKEAAKRSGGHLSGGLAAVVAVLGDEGPHMGRLDPMPSDRLGAKHEGKEFAYIAASVLPGRWR
jgi:hypothetical protein